jgi:hypothetical protein
MRGSINPPTEPIAEGIQSQDNWGSKNPKATVALSSRTAERPRFAGLMRFWIDKIDISHDETPIFTV